MPLAGPSPSARPRTSVELRRLWEGGQRRAAIRGALESWDDLVRQGYELHWLEEALRSCGLSAEALALQVQRTRRQGPNLRTWQAPIRSVLQSGDPWWARELLAEAGSGSRELEELRIDVELDLGGDASALISEWLREHRDAAAVERAVSWLVRGGRVDEAERLLGDADGASPWRARFALWRNQPQQARALLEPLPPSAETRCLEAVVALQEGRLEDAEALLRPLLDGEVGPEAWGWLATVLRKRKRYAEAVQAADAANSASSDFNLALRMERELSVDLGACEAAVPMGRAANASWLVRLLRSVGLSSPPPRASAMRPIGELRHAWAVQHLGLRPDESVAALEPLLDRIAGNHTPHLTTTSDDGRLVSHPLPPDPGQLGPMVQRVLWTRGVDAVRALYRELAPSVDHHPSFLIYEGEFELWMGAYDEAARIFRAALERDENVKWAWIGLGASLMFQGDLPAAHTSWEKGLSLTGPPGPTLFVYRGECYRRQGETTRARAELEEGLRQKPHRFSARINLALLNGDPEELARVEQQCAVVAPLLMEELSGSPAERLEQVLEAMRGNRSSTAVSYHLWGRVWRGAAG